MNRVRKNIRKKIPSTIASKKYKIPRNKLSKGSERPLQGKL
jgi:hypothetical protein